ncbi:MAG: hypothetical protein QOJ64_2309 [Acidobacteriota bacterium]|jgi:hypothetical protein|nr:hypothetical protein [Acidobacteriota bacterium]
MGELSRLFHPLVGSATYSASSLQFTGTPIPDSPHHIAKDSEGQPVILLEVHEAGVRPPSILLRNLQVDHALRCRIRRADGSEVNSRFSVVRCVSTNASLQECFFDLISVLLRQLSNRPTSHQLSDAFDRIAALFLALERPPTRSVQGLWGELFLITKARNTSFLVECWHNDATEHYDFAHGLHRMEVKTCADRSRAHHFSYEQVYSATGVRVAIASMFTEKTTSGVSVGDLWDQGREQVAENSALRLKIDEICIQSLGDNWEEARSVRFDSSLAAESLAFYDVEDIPRIQSQIPPGISNVHFCSNLSFGKTMQERNRALGPLVEAILS